MTARRWGKIGKTITSVVRNVEKLGPSYFGAGTVNDAGTLENSLVGTRKVKHRVTI